MIDKLKELVRAAKAEKLAGGAAKVAEDTAWRKENYKQIIKSDWRNKATEAAKTGATFVAIEISPKSDHAALVAYFKQYGFKAKYQTRELTDYGTQYEIILKW
jgi:hypothetical protein